MAPGNRTGVDASGSEWRRKRRLEEKRFVNQISCTGGVEAVSERPGTPAKIQSVTKGMAALREAGLKAIYPSEDAEPARTRGVDVPTRARARLMAQLSV